MRRTVRRVYRPGQVASAHCCPGSFSSCRLRRRHAAHVCPAGTLGLGGSVCQHDLQPQEGLHVLLPGGPVQRVNEGEVHVLPVVGRQHNRCRPLHGEEVMVAPFKVIRNPLD